MKGEMDVFIFKDYFVVMAISGLEARKFMRKKTGDENYTKFGKNFIPMHRLNQKELKYFYIIDESTYLNEKKMVVDIIDNGIYFEPAVLIAEGNFKMD